MKFFVNKHENFCIQSLKNLKSLTVTLKILEFKTFKNFNYIQFRYPTETRLIMNVYTSNLLPTKMFKEHIVYIRYTEVIYISHRQNIRSVHFTTRSGIK